MPRKKGYRKKKRNARPRGRYGGRSRYRRYKSLSLGFPDSQVAKHRYCQVISLDTDGIVPATNLFRANSMYDPDFTGTGGQPMNRDLYATLYNHYTILGSKITAKFFAYNDLTSVCPAVVWVELLDSTASAAADYIALAERKRAKHKILIMRDQNQVNNAVYNKFSAKHFFGVKDVKDNITRLGAQVGNNPSEDAYFSCGVFPLDGSTNLGAITVIITIDYICQWSEPIPQARS